MALLKAHFDLVEQSLVALGKVASSAGHNLNKGMPREAFISQFLENHISERIKIGTGEIIDGNSKPGDSRNQVDIVLYRPEFPRLHFGGNIWAYLSESVVAAIEIKSLLTYDAIRDSIAAANNIKKLKRSLVSSFRAGYHPPAILNYIVAYKGPASLKTVLSWIEKSHNELGIAYPEMPPSFDARTKIASPAIDGIFILGLGFILFDNSPRYFDNIKDELRAEKPNFRWILGTTESGCLSELFILLTAATSGVSGSWLDINAYTANNPVKMKVEFGGDDSTADNK